MPDPQKKQPAPLQSKHLPIAAKPALNTCPYSFQEMNQAMPFAKTTLKTPATKHRTRVISESAQFFILLFLFIGSVVHDGVPDTRQTPPIKHESQPSQATQRIVRKEIKPKEHQNSTQQRYPGWRWFLFDKRHIKAAPIQEHQPSADQKQQYAQGFHFKKTTIRYQTAAL
ncbi:hypothetical protein AVHY2522_24720 [Acidovorax sp. SUPP2522]|uniref:hypothetical protein n=1 Tax=unclassified Acidovorax TaxID=2684926 RepID=UPI002349911A|nr:MULTISPECIES: hypothetical protein [unclassified Acidovorax]WCM98323.1 hypothetical protein M5C96_02320 [Acidovorax sp. GBBC 1281]GKT20074.1 hypothetical protein AVHY2522_24720 [Acidovorax sp. SUPP2522]